MRKVFANKWFILATTLTISLSTISFATYQKSGTDQCYQKRCSSGDSGDFIRDFISRQLSSVSFH